MLLLLAGSRKQQGKHAMVRKRSLALLKFISVSLRFAALIDFKLGCPGKRNRKEEEQEQEEEEGLSPRRRRRL